MAGSVSRDVNTGPAARTKPAEVDMWLVPASIALAQGTPDCIPRPEVNTHCTVVAPPELWLPAQAAYGWTASATRDDGARRLAVGDLPIGPRSVARLVATAPGVRAWTGEVRLDGTSINYAGGFSMVRAGPASPSRLRGP
jgi:hypothetical protein